PRAPTPAEIVEGRLAGFEPKILEHLWREVADALRVAAPAQRSNGAVLSHHDFWFGNTLWSGERLTGLVDWDGARIDDPGFDVGSSRDTAGGWPSNAPARRVVRSRTSRRARAHRASRAAHCAAPASRDAT